MNWQALRLRTMHVARSATGDMQKYPIFPFNNMVHRSHQRAQTKRMMRLAAARTASASAASQRGSRMIGSARSIITEVSFLALPAFCRAPEYDALYASFVAPGKLLI